MKPNEIHRLLDIKESSDEEWICEKDALMEGLWFAIFWERALCVEYIASLW